MSGGASRSTLDDTMSPASFEGMSIQIEVDVAPPSPWFLPARCHRYLVGVSPFTTDLWSLEGAACLVGQSADLVVELIVAYSELVVDTSLTISSTYSDLVGWPGTMSLGMSWGELIVAL